MMINRRSPVSHKAALPASLARIALRFWGATLLVVCLSCVISGCGRSAKDEVDYFPLAVGNQWTYRRTVFPENIVLLVNPKPGGGASHSPAMESGEETYVITAQNGADFSVEGRDQNGKKIFGIFDPPDFFETQSLVWREVSMPSPMKSRYFDQTRLGRVFGKDVSSIMFICALTPDTDNAKVGDPWKRKLSCLRSTGLVAVPAGTFHDTLKNTITFVRYPLTSQSFRTERMLAKDVGCIKETQYNGDGRITYQLELVAYKTQKGSGGRAQAPPPSPSPSAPTSPVSSSVAKGYRVVDSETGLSSEFRAQYREVCSGRPTAFAAPLAKAKALRSAAPDRDRRQSLDLMIRELTFLRAVAQGDLAIVAPGGEGIVVLGNEGIAPLERGFSDYGVILPTQGWESGLTLGARLATRADCEAALGSAVQAGQWAGAYRHSDGLLLPGLRCGAASAPRTR